MRDKIGFSEQKMKSTIIVSPEITPSERVRPEEVQSRIQRILDGLTPENVAEKTFNPVKIGRTECLQDRIRELDNLSGTFRLLSRGGNDKFDTRSLYDGYTEADFLTILGELRYQIGRAEVLLAASNERGYVFKDILEGSKRK